MNLPDLMLLATVKALVETGRARQLRVSSGLTQEQVGAHCGVTGTAVAHWESGDRTPRGRPALRYAKLLAALSAKSEAVAS